MLVRDPVYIQVADILRRMIQDGLVPAGSQFLSEREVAEKYTVSRVTANKALSSLVSEGWLDTRKGIGNFVREGLAEIDLRKLESFTKQTQQDGYQPKTVILDLISVPIPDHFVHLFKESSSVLFIQRIRFSNEKPVILEERFLPAELLPNLEETDLEGSLYALLESRGITITGAKEKISAVASSPTQSNHLQVPPNTPLLQIDGIGYSYNSPIWVEKTCYRSDQFQFVNEIGWGFQPQENS